MAKTNKNTNAENEENKDTITPVVENAIEAESEKAEAKTKSENTNAKTEAKKKTYIVTTPVAGFCGIVAGVHFAYGQAEVQEGWILNWFKEKGYKVAEKE